MNEAETTKQDWRLSLLRWTVIAGAGAVLCFSLVELFSNDFSKIAILCVAALVSVLVAQFDLPIPRTKAILQPKTVFVFWGVAWLGIFGGAMLALASSIASEKGLAEDRRAWIYRTARDLACAFAAGAAFHFSVQFFGDPRSIVLAGTFLIPNEIVFASCVMALAHFAVGSAIDLLEAKFSRSGIDSDATKRHIVNPSTGQLASLAVAIVLFLTFNHFGIEFGLVLLPIAIATNAAYKIHIHSLDQKTKEILEASRIHLATVEALATAIDARDQVGVGHVRRTQIYAVGLGRLMDLSEGEIDALRTGALLHDIGKLAVPDHILNKPGRLTQAEMEKTKIHSSVGASILEKVGFPMPVVPTVKYHHEFWDGSGYPEGLRGSQIPLTARILAVADAFDTLRGARPYRPAISREDACSFLRAGSGSQFDPKVVDLLIRNLRDFEEEIAAEGLEYDSDADALRFGAERTDYVEQIKQANREVFTLYSLAREFGAAMSLDDTLSLFARKVGEFVPYDACGVFLLEETREFASAAHLAGPKSGLLAGKHVRVGEGATGYALKKNKSVENVDPTLDLLFSAPDGASEFKTMVSRPLVAEDKVIGAISLYSSDLDRYEDEHIRLLETVSKIASDAIAKSLLHAEAATNAMTDPITGLPNARALRLEFDKEVKRAVRNESSFQIMMLDLDGFKAVNDTYGHKLGDQFLTALGGVIRHELRDYDFLARYAGDEFVALIPDTTGNAVKELCKRIENAVDEFAIEVSTTEFARVGVSIGSAAYPSAGESFDQLIISADKAMYTAKAWRKQRKASVASAVDVDSLLAPTPTAEEYVPAGMNDDVAPADDEITRRPQVSGEVLVVELDETHVIATSSVN
jgi:diguanylate cyclase (GGDEF)-like protein/putative nucleotidyltransferase with HDIG domain